MPTNSAIQDSLPDFPSDSGRLFIVATPIGNREDFSPRARRIVGGCDLVLAEDTRRLLALARELDLHVKRVMSFHDHNEEEKEPEVLALLKGGASVALVSDAGTPLVADPGFRLVRSCRKAGIAVHPIPGPSAPVTALSAAGIAPLPYTFLGFLPRDRAGRVRLFSSFATVPTTLVFFERKDRLEASLADAHEILGAREVAVCRELTKIHEEFCFFRLGATKEYPRDLLGEVTVILGPALERQVTPEKEVLALVRERAREAKPRQAAKMVQELVQGWSAKDIYDLLLKEKDAG